MSEEGENQEQDQGQGEAENKDWFPSDWRQQIAGDDEKELAQLGRYKTPSDVWTKARALEQRITSGELKETTAYPAEGTDEEKAQWRKDNGVPESYEKYQLSDTHKLEADDLKVFESFLKHAHEGNYPNAVVDDMVGYFLKQTEATMDADADADKARAQEAEDKLRAEWGNEFRAHNNQIENLMDLVGDGKGKDLLDARMADGTRLGDSVEVKQFLLDMAMAYNPSGTLTPSGGGDIASVVEDRINEIKEVMRTNRPKYDRDEKMQAEYRTLLEQMQKHKSRTAA